MWETIYHLLLKSPKIKSQLRRQSTTWVYQDFSEEKWFQIGTKTAQSAIWKEYVHKLPILDVLGSLSGRFFTAVVPFLIQWGKKRHEKRLEK